MKLVVEFFTKLLTVLNGLEEKNDQIPKCIRKRIQKLYKQFSCNLKFFKVHNLRLCTTNSPSKIIYSKNSTDKFLPGILGF